MNAGHILVAHRGPGKAYLQLEQTQDLLEGKDVEGLIVATEATTAKEMAHLEALKAMARKPGFSDTSIALLHDFLWSMPKVKKSKPKQPSWTPGQTAQMRRGKRK